MSGETFETFVLRKMNQRPGKRMIFTRQEEGAATPQRQLLMQYLEQMKEKERRNLEEKRTKIQLEVQSNERALMDVEKEGFTVDLQKETKKDTFMHGIEEMKTQNHVRRMVEKHREDIANQISKGFFPFTHGDNVERERDMLRSELR